MKEFAISNPILKCIQRMSIIYLLLWKESCRPSLLFNIDLLFFGAHPGFSKRFSQDPSVEGNFQAAFYGLHPEEMKNLKREMIRAQEEIKRVQSVPLVIGQFSVTGLPKHNIWIIFWNAFLAATLK